VKNIIPKHMHAILLTGHGGLEKLVYKTDFEVPIPKSDEVLVKVKGAAINNTDINTRIGWYSKSVTTDSNLGATHGLSEVKAEDGSWSGTPLNFPIIQGADVCGEIVKVGSKVINSVIGERVLVRSMQKCLSKDKEFNCLTLGSELNGGFAQYTAVRSEEVFSINSDWSDIDLASIPCAYSTAEGLLHRAQVKEEIVFITGASGGVGSAAIQLAKRRGSTVIAQCSVEKYKDVKNLGVEKTVARDSDLVKELGRNSVDVVIDLVAGSNWNKLLDILKPGGRYATSGAIGGPIVELDIRTLYLKDLTFYGCTFQPKEIFSNIIKYIENNEIRPLVSRSYPLSEIKKAQKDFISKKFFGKLVLVPPSG